MLNLLRLFRIKNLFIVALVQVLLQYLILKPLLLKNGIDLLLNDQNFILLVLCTIILTAGGYIINDILDLEVDLINKPDKVIIGNSISLSTAKLIYWGFIVFGLFTSFYLAYQIGHLLWFSIFPLSIFLLYLYSKYLKSKALVGNLVVALFCAGVPFIIWFAEHEALLELSSSSFDDYTFIKYVFFAYISFSFITTIIREIIKDMEDVKGDLHGNQQTLPIKIGLAKSKIVVLFFSLILLILLVLWLFWEINFYDPVKISVIIIFLILPVLFLIFKTNKADTKLDFSRLSLLSKIIMLFGVLLLPFYHCL